MAEIVSCSFALGLTSGSFAKEILSLLIPSGEVHFFGMELLFGTCEAALL